MSRSEAHPGDDSQYVAALLGPGDFAAIEALFNTVFRWKPVPPGFAAWRYASTDVAGFCVGVRDPATRSLIASQGIQILPATDGTIVGLSVDVMVHPDHQRKGLGAKMDAFARPEVGSRCTTLMCFPNPKLASLRAKDSRWRVVLRARSHVAIGTAASRTDASRHFRTTDQVPEEAPRLWKRLRDRTPAPTGVARERSYLDWRFAKNPLHRYQWVVLETAGTLEAAAVVKVWIDPVMGTRSGDIVELLAPGGGDSIAMLAAARAHLLAKDVSKVTFWAPWTVASEELAAAGFTPDPELSRALQVQQLRGPEPDYATWFLTESDTDLY